jgi:hypothetical protein
MEGTLYCSLCATFFPSRSWQAYPDCLSDPCCSSRTACDSSLDSRLGFDIFGLDKEEGAHIPELQDRVLQKGFLWGPVTPAYAGIYRCHSSIPHFPNGIPAPSDPLVIIISGQSSCSEWKFTPLNILIPEFSGRNVSNGPMRSTECDLDTGGFSIRNWILWWAEQWSPKENHILIFGACECLCYMT